MKRREMFRTAVYTPVLWMIGMLSVACIEEENVSDDTKSQTAHLCAGTDSLWIGYERFDGMGEGGAGNTLFEENGRVFFIIDGACRYYAFDGTIQDNSFGALSDIRTGMLSSEEAAEISERLKMSQFDALKGKSYYDGTLDCGGSVLFNEDGAFSCDCGCPSFREPAAMSAAAEDIAKELAAQGAPLNGLLRTVTVPHVSECEGFISIYLPEEAAQTPPPGFDPSASAIPECSYSHDNATQSVLLDGDIAGALRDLRRVYREMLVDAEVSVWVNRIPMTVGDDTFDVYLRDYIPFEDANGILCPHDLSLLSLVTP